MRLVWGIVAAIIDDALDVQRVLVSFTTHEGDQQAVCYPALTGRCSVAERVLCNTTAVDRKLGTGGEHFVVAREGAGVPLDDPVPGHIMKLRYTPLQRDVTVVEEPASGHHDVMARARSLQGMPVVCCGLHSQIVLVASAVKEHLPHARIAYVMTDQASLPLAVSRLVPRMLEAGLLNATITTGQSFGGQTEAVTLHSGLLAARHVLNADLAIVSIGPGIPGTATPFGHGGIAQGEAINAVATLGGAPVAVVRLSFADPRPRHVPVSHQTLTALADVALAPARVAVPVLPPAQAEAVDAALEEAGVWARHCRCVSPREVLPDCKGIALCSMGRTPGDDPAFFLAAATAGDVVAALLD